MPTLPEPGQTIRCTISARPRTADAEQTLLRLMRQDPAIRRALRAAQRRRRHTTRFHPRGGRQWAVRPRCGRIARPVPGQSWTMRCTPQLVPDLASVQQLIDIQPL